jgi:hypothetical protein
MFPSSIDGAGLGLRRELILPLKAGVPSAIDFFEISPENWINLGGHWARELRWFTERYPFVAHGLSLSLGGLDPLDEGFLRRIKAILDTHGIGLDTVHLSYCADGGQLYELVPIPFTDEADRWLHLDVNNLYVNSVSMATTPIIFCWTCRASGLPTSMSPDMTGKHPT